MPLRTDLFDYELPERLIAQTPAARRDQSRLLVVDRPRHTIAHHVFADLPRFLRAGDVLFRNNAAVLPARLLAQRPTGGQVECFLLRPVLENLPDTNCHREARETCRLSSEALAKDDGDPASLRQAFGPARPGAQSRRSPQERRRAGLPRRPAPRNDNLTEWWCLLRPGRRLPAGATFAREPAFSATVLARDADGTARVAFTTAGGESLVTIAHRIGQVPLPPYIHRRHTEEQRRLDRERYQTVYADPAQAVAVAAPTAGLHFTPELLARLSAAGVRVADLTLHVGLGTFRPITTATIEQHSIHQELYELPVETQRLVCSADGGRRIAVGTTTMRSVEDFLAGHTAPLDRPYHTATTLFIHPPRTFRGVDVLITNFHQPRSTLLCLVAAFLSPGSTDGVAWIREIYAEAIAREYRFLSYGDAMLVL